MMMRKATIEAGATAPPKRPGVLHQAETANALLRRLPPQEFARLRPHLTHTAVAVGDVLAMAGEPIETVCFLEGGVAGFLDVLGGHRRITVGLVGREGFVGWPLLMCDGYWPYEIQLRAAPATALRVDAARFREFVEENSASRELLLRYAGVFVAQMGRTIVSNLIHAVDQRTARWLLLYHDRLDGDDIAVTHEELGVMLGVRRASVTVALHALEGEGLIRSLRGRVVIRDCAKLRLWADHLAPNSSAKRQS